MASNLQQWLRLHTKEVAIAVGAGVAIAGAAYYLSSRGSAPAAPAASVGPAAGATGAASATATSDEALAAKNAGNEAFKAKKFQDAIGHYTRAIALSPGNKDCSVFYANRAACHLALKDYPAVIADCTQALNIDADYVKALMRRGQAHEALQEYREAIHDYTIICLLKKFQDAETMQTAERTLQAFGRKLAFDHLKERKKSLPGTYHMTMYFEGFRPFESESLGADQISALIKDDPTNGELYRRRALANLHAGRFDAVPEDANQAVNLLQGKLDLDAECDKPTVQGQLMRALELQGTFFYLLSDAVKAIATFDQILALQPDNTNIILRRAVAFLEQGRPDVAYEALNIAVRSAPNDVYSRYHKAQSHLVREEFDRALEELEFCINLKPRFAAPYIHLGLIQLRVRGPDVAQQTFTTARELFPENADILTYEAQMYLQLGNVPKAQELLKQANEMVPTSPLPTLFLAQISIQTGDVETGISLLQKSLQIDPKFDPAYQLLAQLNLQRKDLKKALEYFEKAIENARSLEDLTSAFASREAALAQQHVLDKNPHLRSIVESL